ncbi:uncharacterized protein Dana_GF14350 [Drosophila ananassae]|uniref:Uncharacterized protein n=1 Tax=Drosophila ananassae TaxID=7217 RepID=B3MM02_DROAN|nr:uncharacterized protein LOC6497177 [Drosophila ananassae]EDV31830.1 uncharacterized protein Dana_GF14350 [Drosophila ananassae]
MDELLEIGNAYLNSIGLPAEWHRHWSNIQNVLMDQDENGRPLNLPDVEVVPLHTFHLQEVNPALSAAGDGPHNNPPPLGQNEGILGPALIIFRHRRLRVPFFSFERLMPVVILFSGVIFRKILNHFGIDISQAFLFGLSYNTHFVIFQCIMSFATHWIKDFLGD